MVTPTNSPVAPNPFNMRPAGSPATTTGTGAFEQQLSQALSESLHRLGVAPGSVNITITNNGSASARQILITYNASASTATVPTAPPPVTPLTTPETESTFWSPWEGPRDRRDELPAGGGQVTASGSPLIRLNQQPASNQYGYTGLAALNPYFTSPSHPLREGYVRGFDNWFQDAQILGGIHGPVRANRSYYATEEGAQEALRLVRQYEPNAELVQQTWGGGPYLANIPTYYVKLPDERLINAGLLLTGYYGGGEGVTMASDANLASAVRSA